MRPIHLCLALTTVCSSPACTPKPNETDTYVRPVQPDPGDHAFTLQHDEVERNYLVYVPTKLPAQPSPVVIVLHGGGGSIDSARTGSKMDALANQQDFLVVYPESNQETGRIKWNIGPRHDADPETPPDAREESDYDDVGFLAAMLDVIERDFTVDSDRIYVTGISNGGFMTYRVACELSDRIAAIAPIAALRIFYESAPACEITKPISVMHFHGLQDHLIRYEGGPSDMSYLQGLDPPLGWLHDTAVETVASPDDYMSAQEAIQPFKDHNQCAASPTQETAHGDQATCKTWDCDQGSQVVMCTMQDGGHTWPGGSYGAEPDTWWWYEVLVGHISQDIDATAMMWDFFQAHSLTD